MTAPRTVHASEIAWGPHPALPAGCELAVLLGQPSQPGSFAMRVRNPPGIRVMPHTHPEDRIYTVVSGTLLLGFGRSFDPARFARLETGSVALVPGGSPHFQDTGDEGYVIQIDGVGPSSTDFLDARDDPRPRR
ncbi:MAG TPA: cupin domain-containing protein [Thermoplasmata archaeon]|nr:cupin domain-containing protein [Thermoplasmata archaeon]